MLFAAAVVLAPAAQASTIQFTTPASGLAGGQPVLATATFTIAEGSISVQLANQLADPKADVQNLNGITFQIRDANENPINLPGLALSSSSSEAIFIGADGTYSAPASITPNWGLSLVLGSAGNPGTTASLCALTGCNPNHNPGAEETLIGPPNAVTGTYAQANGSIAGSNPHNPFLYEQATFVLSSGLITGPFQISDVVFSFGTSANNDVVAGALNGPVEAPEPATVASLATGLLLVSLGIVRRRQDRGQRS
jgi:hypothetical protein